MYIVHTHIQYMDRLTEKWLMAMCPACAQAGGMHVHMAVNGTCAGEVNSRWQTEQAEVIPTHPLQAPGVDEEGLDG